MTDHDPTPSPRPPGYDAEESAFDSFTGATGRWPTTSPRR